MERQAQRKLPIGIQDFEKIRLGGYLYVDKTEQIYRLISAESYYFLSRPRRFGKSLLISTVKAAFEGKRELFEGLAAASDMTYQECLDLMRRRYDGYHFEETAPGIYNPFSVLMSLSKKKFGSYWFETVTPTYLVHLLQKYDYNLEEMARVEVDADTLDTVDSELSDPIPVIYQSGYLTIRNYDPQFRTYTLGFPNEEVEEGFTKFLMPFYTCRRDRMATFSIAGFVRDVRDGHTDRFIERLRSLFADTPYELIQNLENHYRNVVWLLFKLMGFYTQAEYRTSQGRIDLMVGTPKYCYVMEFKLDGTAEEALKQIQDRNYTLPFAAGDRQVVRIGINFNRDTRNIDRVLIG